MISIANCGPLSDDLQRASIEPPLAVLNRISRRYSGSLPYLSCSNSPANVGHWPEEKLPAIAALKHPSGSCRAPHVNELPDDFRDLLLELADVGAEFVLVGGHAVAFHGHPRATKDMDVLIRASSSNAARVYRALAAFGAPLSNFQVEAEDFATYSGILQIGLPPRRIDVLNHADGITFDEAIAEGASFTLEGRRIPVIGRAALIKNKLAAGRAQDLADVEAIEKKKD